ncbi:hypothetical protein [Mesorhizobium silamurunense]|uniref:hypothetical protein n=1 Tax=Mesorhizobium silamurunense TaxID=499528 RepID=UPI001781A9AB|nr:hypothetical protein [Mesorhizobium silamurunense]
MIDMPEWLANLPSRFLHQMVATCRTAREKEFAALTNDEAGRIEAIYAQNFGAD